MVCPACGAVNEPGAAVCFTCRAVLTALTRGAVLGGRYEIVRLLGRGGMGAVYEARDRMLDETVALKVLRPELAGDEELVRRFRSEIRLARKVAHANVARIFEYGEGDGLRWISMELVEGSSLKERVQRQGPLPAEEAANLIAQAAQGLEAIHAAGIVHRDLKSANIMLDRQGRVRVMDFGIARAGEGATTGSYTVGTPEYMSPEQGRGRRVDERSDIYSLAIVAFELLTGDVPFRADNSVSTLLMHVEKEPPLRGPAAAGLPPPLVPVLARALAKEPERRFASAREFLVAWNGALPHAGTGPTIMVPERRRRRWWLVAAAAAVAVLLAIRGERRPEPPVPVVAGPRPPSPTAVLAKPAEPGSPPLPTPSSASARASATAGPGRFTRPEPTVPSSREQAAAAASIPPPPVTLPETPSPSEAAPSAPAAVPAPPARGMLFVSATPWAWVAVDGVYVGETPIRPIPLAPGPHVVELKYPAYRPYQRRVVIRPGETFRLRHDWASMGVRESR